MKTRHVTYYTISVKIKRKKDPKKDPGGIRTPDCRFRVYRANQLHYQVTTNEKMMDTEQNFVDLSSSSFVAVFFFLFQKRGGFEPPNPKDHGLNVTHLTTLLPLRKNKKKRKEATLSSLFPPCRADSSLTRLFLFLLFHPTPSHFQRTHTD